MQKLFVLIFIVIINIPIYNLFTNYISDIPSYEKRNLQKYFPYQNNIKEFFSKNDLFFNENFFLRNLFIRQYNRFHWFVLNESPIDEIIKGKDGYILMYSEYHKKNQNLSRELLQSYLNNLLIIKSKLAEKKIDFLFVIVPEKFSIYDDKYPYNIPILTPQSDLEQFVSFLRVNNFNVIDLKGILLEKKNENIYYKTDTHWNNLGAFYGYTLIQKELNLNPLSLDNFIVDYKVSIGLDQGIQLSIPDLLSDTVISLKLKENNFVKKNKALVYHDSYFYAMEQFLNIHYKEIIKHSFVFEDNLNKIEDEAIKNNVDLLLLISLERHLGNHLNRVLLNNR